MVHGPKQYRLVSLAQTHQGERRACRPRQPVEEKYTFNYKSTPHSGLQQPNRTVERTKSNKYGKPDETLLPARSLTLRTDRQTDTYKLNTLPTGGRRVKIYRVGTQNKPVNPDSRQVADGLIIVWTSDTYIQWYLVITDPYITDFGYNGHDFVRYFFRFNLLYLNLRKKSAIFYIFWPFSLPNSPL